MKKPAPTPQTLDRSLDLIIHMADTSSQMTIAEISKMLGVTRTTAYSMINSFMKRNFIEKDPVTGKYFLGYKLYELGDIYCRQYTFIFVAERFVNELSKKWRLRANISVFKPPMTILILFSRHGEAVPALNYGRVCPAYASAAGKCLLAYMPEHLLDEWLTQTEYRKFTPNTIASPSALREELQTIKKQGYSTDNGELVMQNRCVGAPIRNMSGEVIASLSVSGIPKDIYEGNATELIEDVTFTANNISMNLGYNLNFSL